MILELTVSACCITEITWADLKLLIHHMRHDRQERVDTVPEVQSVDWRHLSVPNNYTDILPDDDRVLPLARVTP
jgi:hypothetical protein